MYLKLLLLLMCFSISLVWGQKNEKLYIYHTNDTHSTIEPISINNPDTALAGKGGYVRRATLLKQLRSTYGAEKILLFDSGDFSQGSPYYNLFKGDVEVELMNEMHYDACTIGNHEFDSGLENMAKLFRKARFAVVCANYHFEGTPLDGLVKPYVILYRGGLKIGVFGLGPQLEGLVYSGYRRGVSYEDPVLVANKVSAILREQECCDLVICLSHLGWENDGGDKDVIEKVHGIDIWLGGHSHTDFEKPVFYKDADGKSVVVQQMGRYGRFVGWMEIDYELK